jgi:hypothetical protein
LTNHGPGQYVTDAAFSPLSPGGIEIAYSTGTGVSILDMRSDTTRIAAQCTDSGWIEWDPWGDHVAAVCEGLVVLDPTGAEAPRTVTDAGSVAAFGWSGVGFAIAHVTDGPLDEVRVDMIDVETGSTTAGLPLEHEGIELVVGVTGRIAPDGTHALIEAGLVGSVPGASFESGLYLADHSGGPLRLVAGPNQSFAGWAEDGRAVLTRGYAGDHPVLISNDIVTAKATVLGELPDELGDAIWFAP